MKIICDNCHTKYSISDTKLTPGKVFKIKCKKCGNVIVVKPGAEEQAPADEDATRVVDYSAMSGEGGGAAAAGGAADAPKIWHIVLDKEQEGPFSFDEIKEKVDLGFVKADTFAWREGLDNWQEIVKIGEFTALFPDGAGSAQAPEEPADPFAAASADAGGGAGDDPFAAFDNKASADEAPFGASESKDALFGDDEEEDDANKPQMKGQRHENSVLFSLDNLQALASGGGAKKPMGGARPGYITPSSTGSGLADIQDMAASLSANSAQPAAAPMMDMPAAPVVATPLATAPILTPVAPIAAESEAGGKPKWMMPAMIAVAVIVVLGGVYAMTRGGGKGGSESTKPGNVAANTNPGDMNADMKGDMNADMKGDMNADMKGDMGINGTKVADNMTAPDAMKPEMGTETPNPMNGTDAMKVETNPKDVMKATSTNPKPHKTNYKSNNNTMKKQMKKEMDAPMAETPMGGCTKVWCMLKGNAPACCCKYKPGGCGGNSTSAADPCAANSKAALTRGDIKSGISGVRGRVRSCFSKYGVHGKVNVRVTVGCNGRVQYAGARGSHSSSPVGKCIQRAVRGARFPKFKKKKMSFTYPFIG